MEVQVGMKVTAYASSCINYAILSTTWKGEVIKVNRKSIRVRLSESTSKRDHKVTSRWSLNDEVAYKLVKTLDDGRSLYRSEGKLYGSIII